MVNAMRDTDLKSDGVARYMFGGAILAAGVAYAVLRLLLG